MPLPSPLSAKGIAALERFLGPKTLLAFDFDGTLAPIVREPTAARLRPSTRRLLQELAKVAPVAVISGRGLSDLRGRVPKSVPWAFGNHGAEEKEQRKAAPEVVRWRASLEGRLPKSVRLEDKGLSLSLHYPRSSRAAAARNECLALIETLRPKPRVIPGKFVFNLVGAKAPHKGQALRALMRREKFAHSLYVGDDDTDEDIFRLSPRAVLSIRIGTRKQTAARFSLRSQGDIDRLLDWLRAYFVGMQPVNAAWST